MRILHIGNGRAFKIKAIADAFVTRGHDVHMMPIPPSDGAWNGVTWHRMPDPRVPGRAKVLGRMLQARSLARGLRPDIVHAHNAWGPGWYGAGTGRHPYLIHAYGGDLLPDQYAGRPAIQRQLTSWSCRAADRIIVTGRHMIEAASALNIGQDRMVLLPRGVDLDRYRPGLDTSALRAELHLPTGGPILLSPRYQVDETLYNLDTVVEAFARFRARYPDATCLQLYEPTRQGGRERLESLARSRGLDGSYRLVPAVDNDRMPLFYNLADIVVSVPSSDGFPVTVLEASACEAPLIVSDLPYCAEWFQHGTNGVVVPPRDPSALADGAVQLWADPERRRRFGAAGRDMVAARADYRRCMDELETLYRSLIAHSSTKRGN